MVRIGVICPSEIALRRFMPALMKNKNFVFAGIAYANADNFCFPPDMDEAKRQSILNGEKEKAQVFIDNYGGEIFPSYEAIAVSPGIDTLYIPLPPALHYKWAKIALENGKHVLLEKPATLELSQTQDLISIAKKQSLALHENYMFVFHNQIEHISSLIKNGIVGDVRLYRISFGFPKREANDFRYNKKLGGGALYDAGGYLIKYASMLLGDSINLAYSNMNHTEEFDVDIYGSAAFVNDKGVTVQAAYGMDNEYRCELEVWGSKGMLTTGRILTAPEGFVPEAVIKAGGKEEIIKLPSDDAFAKSIEWFKKCIASEEKRETGYGDISLQASLLEKFLRSATKNLIK
ncbi:MAG: Gfo/Idh/MocA family oxidoreductase [Oscillospiraceae bacterium]|nr:Gfo/Idh/MocA family oxidoreductase [Oscillospiraceae bacterium]